jgi:hypothetical protein
LRAEDIWFALKQKKYHLNILYAMLFWFCFCDEVMNEEFWYWYRFSIPENSMPKEAAYQSIHDELQLDAIPKLNLASFVTTSMEEECNKLIMESINKNYVDMDEYPATTDLHVLHLILILFIARYINAILD